MSSFNEATWYDSNSTVQRKDGLKMIELLAPRKGLKVLDLGCGTGYLSKVLADLVGPDGKVVAVDPDLERLELARSKYTAPNLEYLEGSAENIPGDDYDIIFSNHALHYCVDKNAAFKIIAGKLKKGGEFTFIACVEDDVQKNIKSLPELYGQKFRDAYSNWYHYTSVDDFKRITSANNFKITHSEMIPVKYSFNGVDDLVKFHMTHIRGHFGEEEFNLEAIKRHYGVGAFHINYSYLMIMAKLD